MLCNDMCYLCSTHTYTIDTHTEGEHINVSKVHLVCHVMTLCVADPIWGVSCCDLYTLHQTCSLASSRSDLHGFLTSALADVMHFGGNSHHPPHCRCSPAC